MSDLTSTLECSHSSVYKNLKKTLSDNTWAHNDDLVCSLRAPLQRLCVQYLYLEKRRGYALNPVGMYRVGEWIVGLLENVCIRNPSGKHYRKKLH